MRAYELYNSVMSETDRVTTSAAVARDNLAEIINRAAFGKERVVLSRHGKAVAAVVPLEDLEMLEALEDAADLKAAREAWAEQGDQPPRSYDEVRRELGLE